MISIGRLSTLSDFPELRGSETLTLSVQDLTIYTMTALLPQSEIDKANSITLAYLLTYVMTSDASLHDSEAIHQEETTGGL